MGNMTIGVMNDMWASMYKTESVYNDYSNCCINRMPDIKQVIFNGPATIVLWSDRTKTVVKCDDWDVFDKEKGLAMAIAKRAFGNKGSYNNIFKKWIDESEYDPYIQQCYDQGEQIAFTEVFADVGKAFDYLTEAIGRVGRPDGAEDGDI